MKPTSQAVESVSGVKYISPIEWTNATWNPVRGCSIVSKGCTNCYAMRQAHRQSGPGRAYEGLTQKSKGGPVWTGQVRLVPELLEAPLHWKRPRRIFVNSMSDLFHEALPDEAIDRVFAVMALCPQHAFQCLTKRADRLMRYFTCWPERHERIDNLIHELMESGMDEFPRGRGFPRFCEDWPLPNVWLGVSVEDQKTSDERIPLLLQTPAAVRFVSYEPALGPVNFEQFPLKTLDGGENPGIDWLICGGESGPGARPFEVAWARNTIQQCKAAGVACFVKQLGARPFYHDAASHTWELMLKDSKGGDMAEWPEDLRVREFPR